MTTDPLTVACPICRAAVGEACRGPASMSRAEQRERSPHNGRRRAALDAARADVAAQGARHGGAELAAALALVVESAEEHARQEHERARELDGADAARLDDDAQRVTDAATLVRWAIGLPLAGEQR